MEAESQMRPTGDITGISSNPNENAWVEIQLKTFTNWANEQLKPVGLSVTDLRTDFCDGLKLIALIEVLQKRKLKKIKKPINQHQYIENVQIALNAIASENIKLVNIGSTDIVAGNLKLILGMVWLLIMRYQIGKTSTPPKKLMLSWLEAALPEFNITNFTTDWNSGIALAALVEYCKPGLFANWKSLSPKNAAQNCSQSMRIAQTELNVPMILTPDDLSNTYLDERSGMTYLSYFMKEDGPGYKSTLTWVQKTLPHLQIKNLSTDWNTGLYLCALVTELGGSVPGYPHLSKERESWEQNLQLAINAGKYLGVEPPYSLKAKHFADPNIEHFGVMAYIARFRFIKGRAKREKLRITGKNLNNVFVNTTAHFDIELLEQQLELEHIRAEVHSPSNKLVTSQITLNKLGGTGIFTPNETGIHELSLYYKNEVATTPLQVKVHPDLSKVLFSGIDPCNLGSVVEVLINSNGAGTGNVNVEAISSTGRIIPCLIVEKNGLYTANFTPDEIGEWRIAVTYSGEHINGSPFPCLVFDSNKIIIEGLDYANAGHESSFTCNASDAGWGEVKFKIETQSKDLIPIKVNERGDGIYKVSFTPTIIGKYKVFVTFNGVNIKGSPFLLTVLNSDEIIPEKPLTKKKHLKPTPSPRSTLHSSSSEEHRQRIENITSLLSRNHLETHNMESQMDSLNNDESQTLSSLENQKLFARSTWANDSAKKSFSSDDRIHTQLSSGIKAQKLLNLHRVTANGNGLKLVPVKRPVTFTITAPDFQQDDIGIVVTAPSNREIPFRMDTIKSGHYEVEYITPEVGEHIIEVKALGKPIPGNPFHSSAYDSTKIKVGAIPNGILGKHVQFEIDCSEAGSGNLEILVNGGRVNSEVKNLGNHHFLASFVPHSISFHTIEMKFNGEHVSGSPWKCEIFASQFSSNSQLKKGSLKVQSLESFPVGQTHSFDITAPGFKKEDIEIGIVGPSKIAVQNRILDLQNDTFRVYFSVSIVGTYMFEINVMGQPQMVNAFSSKAYDISRITVSEIPKNSLIGHKCEFQVDASQAGEGQLEIAVNDGEVPNQVQVLGNGKCLVNFTPETLIPHIVDIKFNGENVPGCPFVCEISDATQFNVDLSHIELVPVGMAARFGISSSMPIQPQSIRATITSPNGKQLPVNIEYIEGCVCEFIPQEVGPHIILIEHCGRSISASPLVVKSYDSKKVLVTPVSSGSIGKAVQFIVDASNSGEGNLEIAVNAKGENIVTQVHPMGGAKFGVSFVPNENADHIVSITFNGQAVTGSPFIVYVNPEMNKVSVSGTALHFAPVEQIATLTVHNATSEHDLITKIQGPNGQLINSALKRDPESGAINIEFMPINPGEYLIQLKYMGLPIPGSPFSSKIYDIKRIKVKEIPREIVIGKPVTFIVEASNAGPGNLEVIVNNGKVPSTPKALGPSLYAITFVPKETEDHSIDIKFNGEAVPGSPFTCAVLDASKVTINKEGLEKIAVLSNAKFMIETNGSCLSENSVIILGPTHKTLKALLSGDPQSGYQVEFTPTEVGDHAIDVKIGGASISGCPFLVKAYDSKNVRISEITSGTVGKPIYFSIDASAAGAGNLEIIVSANGRNVPNYVQSEGNAKFRVNFKPTEPSTHVLSVKFNGEPVPGSPYLVKVVDSTQSIISGQTLRMASLGKGVEFTVENRNDDAKECKVVVTSPSGKKIETDVTPQGNGFQVNFKPSEVGPHQVLVLLDGVTVPGCPFSCNIYDVNKVNISGLNSCCVGKPMTFQVDASQAGEGTLELVVTTRKSSVRAEVLMKSRGLYNVTFIPQEIVSHYINITFNEEDVPGSPFKIEVMADSKDLITQNSIIKSVLEEKSDRRINGGLVGSVNTIEFDGTNCDGKIEAVVTGPQQTPVNATAVKTNDNKIKLEYLAKEIGMHKMEIFNDGKAILKKPYFIEVCDPSRVKISDLQDGVVGRDQHFKVDASRAGRGVLSVCIISSDKEIHHNIKEIGCSVFMVSYLPRVDLPHQIDVRYNGHSAPGFPQIVEIRDPTQSIIVHGNGLKSSIPGENATFIIETGGFASAKDFDIIVTDPNGSPLPVKCYQQKNGSLLVEWNPIRTGHHKVDVLHCDKPVLGSPFKCDSFDASKVKLEKIKLNNLVVNKKINFSLNRKDAGYAELDVTVTSPLGRHLPIEVKGMPDGEGELIEFVPTVPGKYKIAITYGGVEVPNSPITFIAQEGITPKVDGSGLQHGIVNEPSNFTIDATDIYGSPEVRVDGPDSEATTTIEKENDLFHVTYVPLEIGVFDVRVLWNGRDIPESPFHPRIVNLQKVRVIGGWDHILDKENKITLSFGEEKRISFDISEAGPGKLTAKLKNPDSVLEEMPVEQTGPHKFRLCFKPKSEGEHQLYLYYAELELVQSPIHVFVNESSQSSDCATVVLRGHGLAGARVGEESEFSIDGTDAGNGQPEVTLTGVKADIPVKVSQISSKVFKAIYTPAIQGTYLLNVIWGQKQVKGCPLKVSILPSCDARRVLCTGEGLKGGSVGKEIKAFIDTRRAGPGELTAHCVGPHKIAYCELYDQMDGTFTLFLKPQEGGKHILTIKYGGEHVSGSPFNLRIAGAPDASKVRVIGPGIEHGVLPLYQSRFICDTRGAGAGQLTVRIRGPKGAFRVEMQRESQKDRTILCKYDPTEPGDYRIEVKWSGEHVPGSPFVVMIFDTQDELSRYLQGHYGTPSGASSLPPLNALECLNNGMSYGTSYGQMSWRGSTAEL